MQVARLSNGGWGNVEVNLDAFPVRLGEVDASGGGVQKLLRRDNGKDVVGIGKVFCGNCVDFIEGEGGDAVSAGLAIVVAKAEEFVEGGGVGDLRWVLLFEFVV